jgi:glycosyltransferase involved in cell wall biosynthesis
LATGDPRVTTQLEFLPDEDLVRIAGAAELVVLPYREMHNSGGVLAALSLDRPVLSPDNDVNRRLAGEVGERWVQRFEPPLTAEILLDTLDRVQSEQAAAPDETPDLSRRDWSRTAAQHVAAYRRAVALRRRPAPR